jgi:hypothetical protein
MTCPKCAQKDEQIAWLESELGIQRDEEIVRRLVEALPCGREYGRPQVASYLACLYAARGRLLSRFQILERVPGRNEDRALDIVGVWTHRARLALGRDAITTVRGHGICLSPSGLEWVARVLGKDEPDVKAFRFRPESVVQDRAA